MKNALAWLKERRYLCLFGCGMLAAAAVYAAGEPRTETVPVCVMFVLALFLLYDSLNAVGMTYPARRPAWMLLLAATAMSFCPGAAEPVFHHLLLLLFFTAVFCRFFGLPAALRLLPPAAVLLLIVPFRASLILYISYPLRRIATLLSAGILCLFDSRITWEGTSIMLPGTGMAITDACSGIAQAEALFLIAYLAVRREPCAFIWKIFHYLFLFPAVMLANALRIILTAALFPLLGEAVFSDAVHLALGYSQVVLALGIFFSAGFILPEAKKEELA